MMLFKKTVSLLLIVAGIFTFLFSETIVFSWIERIIGIEAIVGKENVVYLEDGSYLYTNPMAMILWEGSVSFIGLVLAITGIILLIIRRKSKTSGLLAND